jgi:hypothetical protein
MAVPFFMVSIHVLTDARYRTVGHAGRGLWLDGMAYAATHRTDGFLPTEAVSDGRLARRLVAAGLWAEAPKGYQILDYLGQHRNTPKAKIDEKAEYDRARLQEWREKNKAKSRAVSTPCNTIDTGESLRLEARTQNLEARTQMVEGRSQVEDGQQDTPYPSVDQAKRVLQQIADFRKNTH